jgi:hypothetical protein
MCKATVLECKVASKDVGVGLPYCLVKGGLSAVPNLRV